MLASTDSVGACLPKFFLLTYLQFYKATKGGDTMTKQLKDRIDNFLTELQVPVTKFCKRINLSTQSLYDWRKGKLNLSDSTLKRIDEYLAKYGF